MSELDDIRAQIELDQSDFVRDAYIQAEAWRLYRIATEQAHQLSKWEVYGETMKDTNFHLIDRVDEQAQRIEELEEETLEYAAMAGEDANRIRELETLAVRDEELKAIFGWAAACVKDNGWVDVEYGVQLIRNGKKLAALGTSREDSDE